MLACLSGCLFVWLLAGELACLLVCVLAYLLTIDLSPSSCVSNNYIAIRLWKDAKATLYVGYVLTFQTQPQLAEMRRAQIQARKDAAVENVATVLLRYEGPGTDDEILKALDSKYDALKDKLLLEALKKQLGEGL